jgi:tRNA (cmo5U34)-methyltransferase
VSKLTVEQIRQRFDAEVERFSNLETGQTATIDAPLVLDLVTRAAAVSTPDARDLVDIGCGAGNYTLKLLTLLPHLNVMLVDLSDRMLERAVERVRPQTAGHVSPVQSDVRSLDLGVERVDIILAAAVLHHLRTDAEWKAVFAKCHAALRPGGGFWIADFVDHAAPAVHDLMWARYGAYLETIGGADYRDKVFKYVALEDTPKPVGYQLDLLRQVGFEEIEVLHKNSCFAAFGAVKSSARP